MTSELESTGQFALIAVATTRRMDATGDREGRLSERQPEALLSRRRLLASGTGMAVVTLVPGITCAQTEGTQNDSGQDENAQKWVDTGWCRRWIGND